MLEGVDGGELLGGGVTVELGVLLAGDVGEAAQELVGIFGLGDGFATVEVAAAGIGPGVGADQEAAAGAQGGAGLGGEFTAVASVLLAGVVGLVFEVAELELALAGGVVGDEARGLAVFDGGGLVLWAGATAAVVPVKGVAVSGVDQPKLPLYISKTQPTKNYL